MSTQDPLHVYPHGWDVEWLALDRLGRIGVFTTAGDGPIPSAQLADWDRHVALTRTLLALPEVCEHELFSRVPRPDDFVAFARRGFFAFDWTSAGFRGPRYRLQARPRAPRHVAALGLAADERALLLGCGSPALDFDRRVLDVTAAFPCTP